MHHAVFPRDRDVGRGTVVLGDAEAIPMFDTMRNMSERRVRAR